MREGDVVLTPFPQADGKTKNRPAVVLRVMPPFGDLLVCGVSRQLRHRVPDFDDVITTTDTDFDSSGLVDTSLIRLGFLSLLPASEFLGDIWFHIHGAPSSPAPSAREPYSKANS